jgi:hypothetical protein
MSISLYDAGIGQYLRMLGTLALILDKGLLHCKETGVDPESLTEARLVPELEPLRYQVQQAIHHSHGAVEALKSGKSMPGVPGGPTARYAVLQNLVADARQALQALRPEEINARAGSAIEFEANGRFMDFTAESFLLTFSLPNVYFHTTSAFDILRLKGVPVSKRDYLNWLRPRA